MLSYRSDVTVNQAAGVVFPYLIQPSLQALWSGVPMRQLTEGELRAGSRMEVTFAMGFLKAVVGLELAAVEPGRRVAFKSFSGPIRWDGEYRLQPAGGSSTRVSQDGSLAFRGAWRLLEPIIGAEIGRGEVKELEKLRAVIEQREAGRTAEGAALGG